MRIFNSNRKIKNTKEPWSDLFDEIIGNPPSWILRWGMTLLLATVVVFSTIGWFIKYPDIINVRVTIVSDPPPIRVLARSSGTLKKITVKDKDTVQQGDVLAILNHSISHDQIVSVDSFLQYLAEINSPYEQISLNITEDVNLSSLQNNYSSLIQLIKKFNSLLSKKDVFAKKKSIKKKIVYLEAINSNLTKQKINLDRELAIFNNKYKRDFTLNETGVLSNSDLENSEMSFLQATRQADNIVSTIINNKIQIENLNNQLLDIRQARADEVYTAFLTIKKEAQVLDDELELWKFAYVIKSPIEGIVSFSEKRFEQQFLSVDKELFTIIPLVEQNIVGNALLPIANSGKITIGQKANIKLDNFPYQEYGIISANVSNLSLVPNEEKYLTEFKLPKQLKTTYDIVLPFKQEMQGTAEIITEDKTVLQRIFEKLLSILKNN